VLAVADEVGAVVCAGTDGASPFASADWRRETWAGIV
jgi:hypothetical protein